MIKEPIGDNQAGGGGSSGNPEGPARPASNLFSLEELSRCDGRDGRPAYVAYRGFVFDVSHSSLWKDGRHQARHEAGRDLTEEFASAPHGTLVLARVPIVGRLVPR